LDEEFDVSHLAELPGSEEEVRTAARLVGGPDTDTTLKLGKDATETAIEQTELSSYRVIHFAVHAVADPKNPARAALVPTANDNSFAADRNALRRFTAIQKERILQRIDPRVVGQRRGKLTFNRPTD
jgi:CHAT domain-containing protein